MFEPFFDQYLCNTTFQNGKPVFVAMTPPSNSEGGVSSSKEWKIDIDKLRAAITPKTKMMSVIVTSLVRQDLYNLPLFLASSTHHITRTRFPFCFLFLK